MSLNKAIGIAIDNMPLIKYIINICLKLKKGKPIFISIWILMSTVSFFVCINLTLRFDDYDRNYPYRISVDMRQTNNDIKNMLRDCGHDSYGYWFLTGNDSIINDGKGRISKIKTFISLVKNRIIKSEKFLFTASAYGCEEGRGDGCIFDNYGKSEKFSNSKGLSMSPKMLQFIESDKFVIGYNPPFSFKENEVVFFKMRNSDDSLTDLASNLKSSFNEIYSIIDNRNGVEIYDIYFVKKRDKKEKDVIYIFTLSFGKDAKIACSSSNRTSSPEALLKEIVANSRL